MANTNELPRPILKWAGGKTQMLKDLTPRIPQHYGKYIEPFFGGGALFFSLQPKTAVIGDSNPEIINVYRQIVDNVDAVIEKLKTYENTSEMFYEVRSLIWDELPPIEAAARTLYLNKTCYNGLYRVNRKGQFNTPFGKYKNPTICDEELLRAASAALGQANIICGDYLDILKDNAQPGDFVFLDPPYIPVTKYSDFKRYTKEQFYENDHRNLAVEVKRLYDLGCYVILTNSNHPLVHELYADFSIDVIPTKRAVSSKSSSRTSEDTVVTAFPPEKKVKITDIELPKNVKLYPPTRYMGSKSKLLSHIMAVASNFTYDSVLDLFSGSGVVSYMFKCLGKKVISNDYMAMSATFTKAMVENNGITLSAEEANSILVDNGNSDHFVENTFCGLYFPDEDNRLIDVIRANIFEIGNEYKRAIAMTALIRACTKKRPRGLFTYVGMGEKYNDGRKDLLMPMSEQFLSAVEAVNAAVFDNQQQNLSIWGDAMDYDSEIPDLVYIDPPYYSVKSDNEYVRRYHFVEGLARNWEGVEIQQHTQTKKFKSYPTPFSSRTGASDAFDKLFGKFRNSIIVVSYSSNSLPAEDEMISLIKKHKLHVEVVPIDYTYFFGNRDKNRKHENTAKEYLFVGY